jgi:hypothetical protein
LLYRQRVGVGLAAKTLRTITGRRVLARLECSWTGVLFLKRVILGCILGFSSLAIAEGASDEASLRVAFVYKFMKFIEWPDQASRPSLRLCALGAEGKSRAALGLLNGMPAVTELVDNKPVVKQTVELLYLDDPAAVTQYLKTCQMLYRPAQAAPLVIPSPLPKGVLFVADDAPVAGTDAVIVLARSKDGRTKFSISAAGTSRAGVSVSSQLLKLAKNSQEAKE